MNHRFAWAWCIGTVLAAPALAQAPLDLEPGQCITICAEPAEPCDPPPGSCGDGTCEPAESCSCPADCAVPPTEIACTGGIDEDCDGDVDCQDHDCMGDPACAPPPSGGGEDLGLVRKWHYLHIHTTVAGVMPPETICMDCQGPVGAWGHHMLDLAGNPIPQEATEPDPIWGPTVEADGVRFTRAENDQLQMMRCTSLEPLECEEQPWRADASEPWVLAFVGELSGAAAITGCSMTDCGGINIIDVTASGVLRIRMNTSGRVTLSTTPHLILFDQPLALLVEYDGAGALSVQRRDPCGPWYDATAGAPVNNRPFVVGCLSCYYPNGWENDAGAEEPHYPGFGLLREWRIHEAAPALLRADLQGYLDAEHGAWIDQGCGG